MQDLAMSSRDEFVPLVGREPDAVLFRTPAGAVTAARFLAEARRLAASLPAAPHAVNLCADRYAFALGFAAVLLRGAVSLLPGDRAPDRLGRLAASYPGLYALTDPGEPAAGLSSIASRRTVETDIWTTYPRVRLREGHETLPLIAAPHATPTPLADMTDVVDAGHFRLLGRPGDMVKLGGRRASLAGLTRTLTAIEGVEDGVFLAPPDIEERPSARLLVFAVAPGLEAGQVLAALRARIDPAFLQRRVVLVEQLPRDALGKLPRQAMACLAADAAAG
jgi:hypothetical protein